MEVEIFFYLKLNMSTYKNNLFKRYESALFQYLETEQSFYQKRPKSLQILRTTRRIAQSVMENSFDTETEIHNRPLIKQI